MTKTVVITGAGSGLGRALAKRFADDGDNVVLLGRTLSKVQAAAAEIGARASAVACDVSAPDQVRAAFAEIAARYPAIDVLINNAALVEHIGVVEASDRHILETIGTNLTGPVLCARAAIPLLESGGHIFNVTSGAAERYFGGLALYAASKAALERFSLSLYEELQPQGICVTFVRAGQMVDHQGSWNDDPAIAATVESALAHGLDPRKRPSSTFASVTNAFRALADLPPDLCAASIVLRPRRLPEAD
jgi:meso-butanediol dehydrogenase/(S,S)-butanediol dehydrogenase/diacetyl reductase